ncbi:hypothetical protein CONLIGDRAFT_648981 [Coniochaeta ligniaria NRRL 30616]|uniref:Uncharacterized protein n=1 Tax=Coniochaeta ligniaria NRRL 30616 TaxID=1408157 RepID=A0A1J7J9K2_9PEZI|nr:hypothetical protein CONLIGDRAFT_648981 [Coniochaeta ligniaria NRRL 30616]
MIQAGFYYHDGQVHAGKLRLSHLAHDAVPPDIRRTLDSAGVGYQIWNAGTLRPYSSYRVGGQCSHQEQVAFTNEKVMAISAETSVAVAKVCSDASNPASSLGTVMVILQRLGCMAGDALDKHRKLSGVTGETATFLQNQRDLKPNITFVRKKPRYTKKMGILLDDGGETCHGVMTKIYSQLDFEICRHLTALRIDHNSIDAKQRGLSASKPGYGSIHEILPPCCSDGPPAAPPAPQRPIPHLQPRARWRQGPPPNTDIMTLTTRLRFSCSSLTCSPNPAYSMSVTKEATATVADTDTYATRWSDTGPSSKLYPSFTTLLGIAWTNRCELEATVDGP